MDSWILGVLILILLELMWIASRLGTTTDKAGLQEDLLNELREIREELYWFKHDKFANRLSTEIEHSVMRILQSFAEVREELYWFKDDKFAGHLSHKMDSSLERLTQRLDALCHSLDSIDQRLITSNLSLAHINEMTSILERIEGSMPSR